MTKIGLSLLETYRRNLRASPGRPIHCFSVIKNYSFLNSQAMRLSSVHAERKRKRRSTKPQSKKEWSKECGSLKKERRMQTLEIKTAFRDL